MAYEFTAASSQSLNTTSTPVTGTPLTLSAWIKCDTLPNTLSHIVGIGNLSSNTQYILLQLSSNIPQAVNRSAANILATSLGSITAGQWSHVCGIFPSNSNVSVYMDGVFQASSSASNTSFTPNTLRVARRPNSSGTPFFTGQISECGVWNAALTAAEIASIAKGMTCDKVRPQSLVFYAPLVRDLIDYKGGLTITNNNTATVANHPRVYA